MIPFYRGKNWGSAKSWSWSVGAFRGEDFTAEGCEPTASYLLCDLGIVTPPLWASAAFTETWNKGNSIFSGKSQCAGTESDIQKIVISSASGPGPMPVLGIQRWQDLVPVSKNGLVFRVLPVLRALLPGGGDQCLGQWSHREGSTTLFKPWYL